MDEVMVLCVESWMKVTGWVPRRGRFREFEPNHEAYTDFLHPDWHSKKIVSADTTGNYVATTIAPTGTISLVAEMSVH